MADLNDLIEDPNAKLSRRNVVVGTAWAVPVIMAVGAAPAMAVSTGSASATIVTGPLGGHWVRFRATATGAKPGDTVRVMSISNNGNPVAWLFAPVTLPIADGDAQISFKALIPPNNPKEAYTITYQITGLGTQTVTFYY